MRTDVPGEDEGPVTDRGGGGGGGDPRPFRVPTRAQSQVTAAFNLTP